MKEVQKGLVALVVFLLLGEVLLRSAYLVRNSLLDYIPLAMPLIDSSALLAEARRNTERRLERELGLEPAVRPPMSGDGMAS